jgi:hypothetical protein
MEIKQSVFALAKYNNGFFKSEKQGKFLISMIEKRQGTIGSTFVGRSDQNSYGIYADYDLQGITKIYKHNSKGLVVMFERKVEGVLTEAQIKKIKSLNRVITKLNKELVTKEESFFSGNYDYSGDINSYTQDTVELYVWFQNRARQEIKNTIFFISKLS